MISCEGFKCLYQAVCGILIVITRRKGCLCEDPVKINRLPVLDRNPGCIIVLLSTAGPEGYAAGSFL